MADLKLCATGGGMAYSFRARIDRDLVAQAFRPAADSWRLWLPSALLLVVAAVQVTLVQAIALSPWKGGGFGMFAAVDGGAVRSVRILVEAPGRSEELLVPPSLEFDADRAAAFPSEGFLARLARRVALREGRYGRPVNRVTVEAWSATPADDGSQVEAHRLAVHVHEVAADDDE